MVQRYALALTAIPGEPSCPHCKTRMLYADTKTNIHGEYVLHTDYEKLEQERDSLRAALDKLRDLYTCAAGNAHGCQGHRIYTAIDKALQESV